MKALGCMLRVCLVFRVIMIDKDSRDETSVPAGKAAIFLFCLHFWFALVDMRPFLFVIFG